MTPLDRGVLPNCCLNQLVATKRSAWRRGHGVERREPEWRGREVDLLSSGELGRGPAHSVIFARTSTPSVPTDEALGPGVSPLPNG